jgi:hypothetical protein
MYYHKKYYDGLLLITGLFACLSMAVILIHAAFGA